MHRPPRTLVSAAVAALIGLVATAPASAQSNPALDWNNYEKITLAPPGATTNGGPLDLAVMPDKKVLFTNRNGLLRLTDPATGITKTVNTFNVYVGPEEGLQTVSLDPDFATNKWVYIFYSPAASTMTGNDPWGRPYPTTLPGNSPSTMPANTVPFDEPRCYPLADACQGAFPLFWQQYKGYNQLSRFKWNDATQSLDMSTEQKIIRIDAQRGQCCHLGTDVAFDSNGNLYLSTGDNTPSGAFGSGGLAPMSDDTPGINPGVDARRSSGNTNDLRGKILRIKVKETPTGEGLGLSYDVPAGNLREYVRTTYPSLVTPDFDAKFAPEIYVMGLRNPFRISIDPDTDELSWGDYGPDNGNPTPLRGPMGVVEWQVTSKPMNAGWPYCLGSNSRTDDPALTSDGPFGFSHNDYNFFTSTQGAWYDCNTTGALFNDSRWNTGLRIIPPATPATAFYGDRVTDQPRPEFAGPNSFKSANVNAFQSPMGGPKYHFDASNPSPSKWPAHWDGKWMFYEFDNRYISAMGTTRDADGNIALTTMENILPNFWTSAITSFTGPDLNSRGIRLWHNVIDMEFGPDGALYTLEYGQGGNTNTALVRTDYAVGNKTPQALATASPVSSSGAPLTVNFSGAGSTDPEGSALTYEWDFDGNGTFDATGVTASHTYVTVGAYTARLRVTDPSGKFGLSTVAVTVGNQAPELTVSAPADGGFFSWGDAFVFNATATDAEDGATPVCTRMARTWSLGHNAHSHGISTGTGCTGAITTVADASHGANEDAYGVLQFDYTDAGAAGVGAATSTKVLQLNLRLQQAEFADVRDGVTVVDDATASGGRYVGSFNSTDHLEYAPMNFLNIASVRVTGRGDGTISLRWGAADAPAFATAAITDGTSWQTVTSAFGTVPVGTGTLFVTSNGGVQLDSLEFVGDGVADKTPPTVTATIAPAAPNGLNGWYTGNVTLTVDATDNGAVSTRQYSTNGGETWTNTAANGTAMINTQGVTNVLYRATDTGGNISAVGGPITFRRDTVAPVSTATLNPAAPGPGGFYDGSPTISISATDAGSGLATSEYMVDGGPWTTYTGPFRVGPGPHVVQYRSTDVAGLVETAKTLPAFNVAAIEDGNVGGSVPATLSLTLGASASFGPFTPGVAREYSASTTANVVSTAGDAALTAADPSSANTGMLVNGAFALPQTLQVNASNAASAAGAFAPVGGSASPTALLSWSAPVSNDAVTIGFKQAIGASDALRTGTYSKTLTFTLSTTTP